jgi:hypothetical protein
MHLTVAFDRFMPTARWGGLFHVLRLEQPGVELHWQADGYPTIGRSLLNGADVGLFLAPPCPPGLSALTIETSPMAVVMAAGHRLAVIDEPFPGGPDLDPAWRAFWTLDALRGGPPTLAGDDVADIERGLDVVAAGLAIATVAASSAEALPHLGVVALPLRGGPPVETRLVWPSDAENPMVHALVDLAVAWTRRRP